MTCPPSRSTSTSTSSTRPAWTIPAQLAADGKWTWDAFEETAKAITDLGGGVKGFGAGGWWANWGYFVNSAGGSFFNEDRTACNLDSPESINGIEYYQNLYADDVRRHVR